ncbi:hypothetical protein AAFF_G00252000 [Aldrovandia affinis]|uniref:Uncharacterized protein n=1 Tax=Aldrovandia affinis TaxID=143900 RepID=A0AAD7STY3_9TELE|nr:hypothetical protein AAFF_G00252000 [Aldrovandia affinis]
MAGERHWAAADRCLFFRLGRRGGVWLYFVGSRMGGAVGIGNLTGAAGASCLVSEPGPGPCTQRGPTAIGQTAESISPRNDGIGREPLRWVGWVGSASGRYKRRPSPAAGAH